MVEFYTTIQATEAERNDAQQQIGECSEALSETEASLQDCQAGVTPTECPEPSAGLMLLFGTLGLTGIEKRRGSS